MQVGNLLGSFPGSANHRTFPGRWHSRPIGRECERRRYAVPVVAWARSTVDKGGRWEHRGREATPKPHVLSSGDAPLKFFIRQLGDHPVHWRFAELQPSVRNRQRAGDEHGLGRRPHHRREAPSRRADAHLQVVPPHGPEGWRLVRNSSRSALRSTAPLDDFKLWQALQLVRTGRRRMVQDPRAPLRRVANDAISGSGGTGSYVAGTRARLRTKSPGRSGSASFSPPASRL